MKPGPKHETKREKWHINAEEGPLSAVDCLSIPVWRIHRHAKTSKTVAPKNSKFKFSIYGGVRAGYKNMGSVEPYNETE